MYQISLDEERRVLRAELTGLWDLETLDSYASERTAKLKSAGWRTGEFDDLVDLRKHHVQAKEVAAKGDEYCLSAEPRPRKLALIVTSALSRMQVARIVDGTVEKLFDNEQAALDWLAEK